VLGAHLVDHGGRLGLGPRRDIDVPVVLVEDVDEFLAEAARAAGDDEYLERLGELELVGCDFGVFF